MRKVLAFLGVSLSLAWAAPAATAQDMFKDVPQEHWAYTAVGNLQKKGILKGYPDVLYRGKRTLTRYEFAVALDRLLNSDDFKQRGTPTPGPQGPAGPPGPQGPQGPAGPQGPPGIRPEEVDALRRLIAEFRPELAKLGNDIAAINRKLDDLAKRVATIEDTLSKMPKIGGGVFMGVRSDRSNGLFVDKDGHINGSSVTPGGANFVNPTVVHNFMLTVDAKVGDAGTLSAGITTGNYRNYVGTYGYINPTLNTTPGTDVYIDHLELTTPFTSLGRDSALTLGRYAYKISPLLFYKPDVDTYFSVPGVDDGAYRLDGAKLATKFGSVFLEVAAGQTRSASGLGTVTSPFNSPLVGISTPSIFFNGQKPIGQLIGAGGPQQGQMTVDQLISVSGGLKFNLSGKNGYARLTGMDLSGGRTATDFKGAGFNNAYVVGADVNLELAEKLTFNAQYGKTITNLGRLDTVNNSQNNAFDAKVGYKLGALNLTAGYKYVDPLFYSPGYWGRIGNWINPTNIQGPTFRAGYDVNSMLGVTLGGDFYTAARNRAGVGGLSSDDNINRVLAGVKLNLSKTFSTTFDYEGVFWSLSGAHAGLPNLAGNVHPYEHYFTIGTGLNLTDTTMLKLSYQIGGFNGQAGPSGLSALGGGTSGLGRYTFNTFTGQVAVKF